MSLDFRHKLVPYAFAVSALVSSFAGYKNLAMDMGWYNPVKCEHCIEISHLENKSKKLGKEKFDVLMYNNSYGSNPKSDNLPSLENIIREKNLVDAALITKKDMPHTKEYFLEKAEHEANKDIYWKKAVVYLLGASLLCAGYFVSPWIIAANEYQKEHKK